jgi:hypothetical protein
MSAGRSHLPHWRVEINIGQEHKRTQFPCQDNRLELEWVEQ